MPSPFPGMDPYLENPALFPNFHLQMISQIQGALNRVLRPKYQACVEERVYISAEDDPGRKFIIPDIEVRPSKRKAKLAKVVRGSGKTAILDVPEPIIATSLIDDEIHERFLNVTDVASKEIVAIIEVLSPINKCSGATGRVQYMTKRRDLMRSNTHLVEIDLLRDGTQTFDRDVLPPHHYAVHISHVAMRPKGKFWPILMRHTLPIIGIPLRNRDPDVALDLQAVFDAAYEFGAYDLGIDYKKAPVPPLAPELRKWAAGLCRKWTS